MGLLNYLGDLVLNKKSLPRVLTEIELEQLSRVARSVKPRRVLIAGGGHKSGSEHSLKVEATLIAVNISKNSYPDVVADLTTS